MINKERLLKHLNAMQTISTIDDVPGINRIAFTNQDWAGRDYLIKQLKELNLTLRYDEFGNVIGRYEGKKSGCTRYYDRLSHRQRTARR